jgi:hypothetical protein
LVLLLTISKGCGFIRSRRRIGHGTSGFVNLPEADLAALSQLFP